MEAVPDIVFPVQEGQISFLEIRINTMKVTADHFPVYFRAQEMYVEITRFTVKQLIGIITGKLAEPGIEVPDFIKIDEDLFHDSSFFCSSRSFAYFRKVA